MPASLLGCIDFTTQHPGTGPNPRVAGGASLTVLVLGGTPSPSTALKQQGTFRGFDCGHELDVAFRKPVRMVCLSIVRFAQAGRVTFFSPAGSVVGVIPRAGPQSTAQHLACSSTAGIARIVVIAPKQETLLLELCAA
jgi:hypothetical protein